MAQIDRQPEPYQTPHDVSGNDSSNLNRRHVFSASCTVAAILSMLSGLFWVVARGLYEPLDSQVDRVLNQVFLFLPLGFAVIGFAFALHEAARRTVVGISLLTLNGLLVTFFAWVVWNYARPLFAS